MARADVIEYLRQRSRPYLFSNSLPPPIVMAARKALELVGASNELRDRLHANAKRMRAGLESAGFTVEELECYGFPLSNLVEPLRAWSHARALRRGAGEEKAAATAQSGVARGLEARLWPLQAGLPGRLLFRAAFRLQTIFRHRDLGTGYLVLARRTP